MRGGGSAGGRWGGGGRLQSDGEVHLPLLLLTMVTVMMMVVVIVMVIVMAKKQPECQPPSCCPPCRSHHLRCGSTLRVRGRCRSDWHANCNKMSLMCCHRDYWCCCNYFVSNYSKHCYNQRNIVTRVSNLRSIAVILRALRSVSASCARNFFVTSLKCCSSC